MEGTIKEWEKTNHLNLCNLTHEHIRVVLRPNKIIGLCFVSDPELLMAHENESVELGLTEPGTEGSYEEITWYKIATSLSTTLIVIVYPAGGKPLYYNEYCSSSWTCLSSDKGKLDLNTGSLTINKVRLSDEGYYYYDFYADTEPDTGHKYEIQLLWESVSKSTS